MNESAIDSATLNPVIRRQVYRHIGPAKLEDDGVLVVRVYHGRRHCHEITGRAWKSRRQLSIVIPPRLFRTADDWIEHAPRFAQVVAIVAARYSGRHPFLEAQFGATPPAAIDEFAAASEIPFALRGGNGPMLSMEARLEFLILERRRTGEIFVKARRKYQRYRNWEKQLRHRLRKMGSHV